MCESTRNVGLVEEECDYKDKSARLRMRED